MAEQKEPRITNTPLEAIHLDGGTQIREKLDESYIAELCALVKADVKLPPIDVFWDGESFWLGDGYHRFFAHQRAKEVRMLAVIHWGTLQEAIRHAIQANHTHGLRRTNKDKRNCVLKALADPEWGKLSDRNLADKCGVNDMTVAKFRKKAAADPPTVPPDARAEVLHLDQETPEPAAPETVAPETREGLDGKQYPAPSDPAPTVAEGPKDRLGHPLPGRLWVVFQARSAMEGYARKLGTIAKRAVEGLKDKPEARALDLLGLDNHLSTAQSLLRAAKPYCLCPLCQGRGCDSCRKSGWLTKVGYEGIPREKRWPKRDAA